MEKKNKNYRYMCIYINFKSEVWYLENKIKIIIKCSLGLC